MSLIVRNTKVIITAIRATIARRIIIIKTPARMSCPGPSASTAPRPTATAALPATPGASAVLSTTGMKLNITLGTIFPRRLKNSTTPIVIG